MTSTQFPGDHRSYKIVRNIFGAVIFIAGLGLIMGLLVQFLWNATIAETFQLTAISFWQAVGLFILAKLFFGFGTSNDKPEMIFRRKRKKEAPETDEQAVPDDQAFRRYWKEEGRTAYEQFLANQDKAEDTGA